MESYQLFSDLSTNQKTAIFVLVSSLRSRKGSYNQQMASVNLIEMVMNTINLSENALEKSMASGFVPSMDNMITTLKTIKDKDVMEWLIIVAFQQVSIANDDFVFNAFLNIFSELGYDENTLRAIIEKGRSFMEYFR